MTRADEEIASQLFQGERLLWSGQPRQELLFRASDALMIPLSVLWSGFVVFWEYQVLSSSQSLFMALFGLPFVGVGLYVLVGRFFVEAKQRSRTFYALTNERILIVSGVYSWQTRSLFLRNLSEISVSETRGEWGTITFGSAPFAALLAGFSS